MRFYNKEVGSLSVALRDGISTSIPGKSWVDLSDSDASCEDVIRAVAKGFLVRGVDLTQGDPAPWVAPKVAESSEVSKADSSAGPIDDLAVEVSKKSKKA